MTIIWFLWKKNVHFYHYFVEISSHEQTQFVIGIFLQIKSSDCLCYCLWRWWCWRQIIEWQKKGFWLLFQIEMMFKIRLNFPNEQISIDKIRKFNQYCLTWSIYKFNIETFIYLATYIFDVYVFFFFLFFVAIIIMREYTLYIFSLFNSTLSVWLCMINVNSYFRRTQTKLFLLLFFVI